MTCKKSVSIMKGPFTLRTWWNGPTRFFGNLFCVRYTESAPYIWRGQASAGAEPSGRLPSVRVLDAQRQLLTKLLHDALHHAGGLPLRDCRFRPALADALARVGLQPQNFPERLGRAKLIEELLDRITERGFLNMGDLRDALARNQLKLPDLSGPREFIHGDQLIRVNRELAVGRGECLSPG